MISMDEAEYPGYGGPDPADSDHDSGSSASLERNWPAKLSSRRCHDLDQISLVAMGVARQVTQPTRTSVLYDFRVVWQSRGLVSCSKT
jgi:hypothetical protein